jgi:ABC-2 type transport system permease protein
VIPLFSLAVALVLGFFIALFSSKIRNKSIISVVFSLVFFGLYYFSMMRIGDIINILVYQSDIVTGFIKKWLYPFYLLGRGINGEILCFVLFCIVTFAVFGVIYLVLSQTFLRLATVNKGQKKLKYKEKRATQASAKLAFLKKELLYFKNTPVYILNCSFGSLMVIVAAIVFAVKKKELLSLMAQSGFPVFSLPLIIGIALCIVASSNNLSSVSASLEGRNIYLLHSLPCVITDVFFGKIMLHTVITGIPLIVGNIIISISLSTDIITAVLLVVFSIVFTFVLAVTGLVINLLFPKMEWTNETVPIKQSLSSLLGIFSGFAYGIVLLFTSIVTAGFLSMPVFLLIALILFALTAALLLRWLSKKGIKKFMNL